MQNFQTALDAHLRSFEGGEAVFADVIGCKQATVNRYRNGKRFPDAETARQIDNASNGAVPFSLWQQEFLTRSGITPSPDREKAA